MRGGRWLSVGRGALGEGKGWMRSMRKKGGGREEEEGEDEEHGKDGRHEDEGLENEEWGIEGGCR